MRYRMCKVSFEWSYSRSVLQKIQDYKKIYLHMKKNWGEEIRCIQNMLKSQKDASERQIDKY